jgi:chromosome segregation protein
MHLSSITMKGFKSFPDRTRLEFAPGVSVIVGPNGSGKSNVTDAVLWALGEQSPLAVRGQTMQDVIFSGSSGLGSRAGAEVEVVIDDAERALGTEFSQLAIVRRLDRSGEGEYRMNGARCRLVDVLEALSDTGLGKEMHSVVSQGRVEAVVHSSARERRLLIEEAAGLGKHRRRRRRAELKLRRTSDNLARALDVEREARGRLRPLKRQAEAAEVQARIERQSLEAKLELARDDARGTAAALARAESDARGARSRREAAEGGLDAVRARREEAERSFAGAARAREELSRRHFAATSAADRVELRLERVRALATQAATGARRAAEELRRLATPGADATGSPGAPDDRIGEIERQLQALDAAGDVARAGPDAELERLRAERSEADARHAAAVSAAAERAAARSAADGDVESARSARRAAASALEEARSVAARAAAEVEAVEQLARGAAAAPGSAGALAGHLDVEPGYELALAAALGPRLRAGLARDRSEGAAILDATPGAALLVLGTPAPYDGDHRDAREPPAPGAERLADRVVAGPAARAAADRLLVDVWVVESLETLPASFRGVAVTRSGRALLAGAGELRQAAPGAEDALLERLGRRRDLERAAADAREHARAAEERDADAAAALAGAERARDEAAEASLLADRDRDRADEAVDAAGRAMIRREAQLDESAAIRRAELTAELRAERRVAERAERERAARDERRARLTARVDGEEALAEAARAAAPAIGAALEAITAHRESLHAQLAADEASGARAGETLRECAREEAEVQAELREAGEVVTRAEVDAQRARDAAAETTHDVELLEERLRAHGPGAPGASGGARLTDERRAELAGRIARLAQRSERLGPVNPLAKAEYEDAVARVEELEAQRRDLETALAELEGIVAETDRRIRERFESTFAATARNFEEVVEELFPGGRGRLRLAAEPRPRPVLGDEGEAAGADSPGAMEAEDATDVPEAETEPDPAEPGVEVEVTPAGKSMRRLSLMSGGERSLVALAFLFAVFLARPCPFYVLDEVEAALDDPNIDRFLRLVRRCSERAQFIVVTHQRRTMDAADRLYGVSMGADGVSKVVSRRLSREAGAAGTDSSAEEAA